MSLHRPPHEPAPTERPSKQRCRKRWAALAATTLTATALTAGIYTTGGGQLPDLNNWPTPQSPSPTATYSHPQASTQGAQDTTELRPAVDIASTGTEPETGKTIYYPEPENPGEEMLGLIYNETTNNFTTYAPLPAHTFTREESQCDLTTPKNETNLTGTPTTWAIPSLGPNVKTGYTQTNFQLPAHYDAAGRYGTWKSDTAPLGSATGAGIYAGHVNNPNGSKSPWGYSHNIQPCTSLYITDESGAQYEYKAAELRLIIDPASIATDPEYWRLDGPTSLYFITCAGPWGVGDDGQGQFGGSLFGNYPYRIVVVWDPVVS